MLIEVGEKVHVITRRMFEKDIRRHFAGQVTGVEGSTIRVQGYSFAFNPGTNEFMKRVNTRVRLFTPDGGMNIITVLPESVSLEKLDYEFTDERKLVITDGTFSMDVQDVSAYA